MPREVQHTVESTRPFPPEARASLELYLDHARKWARRGVVLLLLGGTTALPLLPLEGPLGTLHQVYVVAFLIPYLVVGLFLVSGLALIADFVSTRGTVRRAFARGCLVHLEGHGRLVWTRWGRSSALFWQFEDGRGFGPLPRRHVDWFGGEKGEEAPLELASLDFVLPGALGSGSVWLPKIVWLLSFNGRPFPRVVGVFEERFLTEGASLDPKHPRA